VVGMAVVVVVVVMAVLVLVLVGGEWSAWRGGWP